MSYCVVLLLLIAHVSLGYLIQPHDFGMWTNCTWSETGNNPEHFGCSSVKLPNYEAGGLEPISTQRLEVCNGDYSISKGLTITFSCATYWCPSAQGIQTTAESDRTKIPARYAFMWTYCTYCKDMQLTHESFEGFINTINTTDSCYVGIKEKSWDNCGSWSGSGFSYLQPFSNNPSMCYCHTVDKFFWSCAGNPAVWLGYILYAPLAFAPVYIIIAIIVLVISIIPSTVKGAKDLLALKITNPIVRMNTIKLIAQWVLLLAVMILVADDVMGLPLTWHYNARWPTTKPVFGVTPLLLLVVNTLSILSWASILASAEEFPLYKVFV
jgi:hypothetical protein